MWADFFSVPKRKKKKNVTTLECEALGIDESKYRDAQKKYYRKCYYLLKKLGLKIYYLESDFNDSYPLARVEIDDESHPYYNELKEYWGVNDSYVGLNTGEYDERYKYHYAVLKKCDEVIKKAKAN